MIVVDSSVLIDFVNGYATPSASRLTDLLSHESILIGDVVLCEVLKGARTEAHARMLQHELRRFEWVQMLDANIAVAAAENYRRLRSKGFTIFKTIDLIIGTFCIAHRYTLLHSDRDFDPMVRWLGLKAVNTTYMVNEPELAYG